MAGAGINCARRPSSSTPGECGARSRSTSRPDRRNARRPSARPIGRPAHGPRVPYGVYPIEGAINIGRSDESDVFLVDPSVSRKHAVIDVDAGWPIVHDLESTNGTFVNGERIETRRLSEGDLVAFGKTELRLEVAGA